MEHSGSQCKFLGRPTYVEALYFAAEFFFFRRPLLPINCKPQPNVIFYSDISPILPVFKFLTGGVRNLASFFHPQSTLTRCSVETRQRQF